MCIKKWIMWPHNVVMWLQRFDFLAPCTLRAYLVPIFWMAGTTKLGDIHAVALWFGDHNSGLGLPFPLFFAYLAALTEVTGAVLLTFGFGVRYIVVPLSITMLVAIFAVHFEHGWDAIAGMDTKAAMNLNNLLAWLKEHYPMRYEFATQLGQPVALNNGVQYAVTYLVMLITLFFTGGGRYLSLDYWIGRRFCPAMKA